MVRNLGSSSKPQVAKSGSGRPPYARIGAQEPRIVVESGETWRSGSTGRITYISRHQQGTRALAVRIYLHGIIQCPIHPLYSATNSAVSSTSSYACLYPYRDEEQEREMVEHRLPRALPPIGPCPSQQHKHQSLTVVDCSGSPRSVIPHLAQALLRRPFWWRTETE